MPASYPTWKPDTPHTDDAAKPCATRRVSGVFAIRVAGASYRGSHPFDGVLELVSTRPQTVKGERRFEVYCGWHGVKSRGTFPRISPGKYEILMDYTGEVIDNISS